VTTRVEASPLTAAALALVDPAAGATELVARFASAGADLRPGEAGRLLDELASLGLVRVARETAAGPEFVPTSLGHQLLERGLGAGAVRLQELERLRTDLLSTIAHELRTPLTAIRTSAGLLLDPASMPSDEQRRTMLETIERNADRMQRLIGDILDLARFRSGSVRLQLRRFDPVELAQSVVDAIEPLAAERSQLLELDAAPAEDRVFGDHARLERALLNLVSNAQRFSPTGGRIVVRVETGTRLTRWAVTDEGPGIPDEDRERLFERFFVGRNDLNQAREGTGLGLPIALAIAQAHGGTIEVDSRPGAGSTFALVVPTDGPSEAG
jgi:signal transduction histidine kinase